MDTKKNCYKKKPNKNDCKFFTLTKIYIYILKKNRLQRILSVAMLVHGVFFNYLNEKNK